MRNIDDFKLGMMALSCEYNEASKVMIKCITRDKLFHPDIIKEIKKILKAMNEATLDKLNELSPQEIGYLYDTWVSATKESSAKVLSEPGQEHTFTK